MGKKTFFIILTLLVIAILALVFIPRFLNPQSEISQEGWQWQTITPEEQGMDSARLAELLLYIKENEIKIDSLLIIRNGKILLDAYFYPYEPSIPHKLASVTKSFTTTLIGIAADQGFLQLDQSMVSFFPDRTIANLDEWKKSITVSHLVSNMNGFESGCLSGDETTLDKMRSNEDWIQAALDRKMVTEPGTRFCYDSPGMHLLSAILQQATGMTELEFAHKYLFEPLGITQVYWEPDPQGYSHGWGDLYLKPLDAAKLGYLWLNKGAWEGRQIISTDWVEEAVKPNVHGGMDYYGYGWWVSEDSYYAFGRGGQNIKVMPSINTIIVTTATSIDYDDIAMKLSAAFIDADHPLPVNPDGVAELESALAAISAGSPPVQTGPLPEISRAITGKTYDMEPNELDLRTIRFMFDGIEQAMIYLNLGGNDHAWPIGLDGEYRLEPDGRSLRGYWSDPQTFMFELFENGLSSFQFHFEGDQVVLTTPAGSEIVGMEQKP